MTSSSPLPNASYATNLTVDSTAFSLRYSLPGTIILATAYGLVCLTGVLGNVAVCLVVARSRKMRSPTNLFIANLAFADLLVNLLCLPFTLIGNLFPAWILGVFFCKAVSYFQGVSVSASVNTLAAISIERCLAIASPLSRAMTRRKCRVAVAAIWLVALSINLPWLFVFTLEPLSAGSKAKICIELWPSQQSENVFFLLANLLLCYLLPLAIISLCYLIIWHKVSNRHLPSEFVPNRKHDVHLKSKVKVLKMILVVIVTFALSWLPLYAIFCFVKFAGDEYYEDENVMTLIHIALPVAQWLGASNSCINPILYAFLNKKFRWGFWSILQRPCRAQSMAEIEIREIRIRNGRISSQCHSRSWSCRVNHVK